MFIFCVWEKGWSKGQPFFVLVYYLCTVPAQVSGESLPGQPGNVLPAATAAQNHPGKVSLAVTAALTSEKKLKYFLPMCCELVK